MARFECRELNLSVKWIGISYQDMIKFLLLVLRKSQWTGMDNPGTIKLLKIAHAVLVISLLYFLLFFLAVIALIVSR